MINLKVVSLNPYEIVIYLTNMSILFKSKALVLLSLSSHRNHLKFHSS